MIILLLVILPMLFHFQNTHKWDVLIGEYSYPIYICHFLVNWIVFEFNIQNIYLYSFWVLSLTLLFAHVTIRLVIRPVEKIRKRNKVSQ